MDVWIRSQDKMILSKINNIKLIDYDEEYSLVGYCERELDNFDLGVYETKERALEILDEIQNILKPKYILDSSSIKPAGDSWVENGIILQKYNANARVEELSTYVYEMPQE